MFRIISESADPALDNVHNARIISHPNPHFLLLCDSRNCFSHFTYAIDLSSSDPAHMQRAQETFFKSAIDAGWAIGWDAQLCPGHYRRVLAQNAQAARAAQEAAERQKLVKIAADVPVALKSRDLRRN